MRSIKTLFLLSIGMMVSTAFASTQMPEKNQKATVELSQKPLTVVHVLSIETQFSEVILNADSTQLFLVKSHDDHFPTAAILVDNRWCISPGRFKPIPYVEKLNSKRLLDKKDQLKNIGISTARNNC